MNHFWLSLFASILASMLAIPFVRWLSVRTGRISLPRSDRWHSRPTPMLGGVAMFLGFCAGMLPIFFSDIEYVINWPLLFAAGVMFLLGLYDDYRRINPSSKLIVQLAAATVVIFWGGLVIRFFPWPIANILLTIFWLVGITNGINLLDNMDGIAGGIAMIAAGVLGLQFWIGGDTFPLWLAAALFGSVLSFLIFNFPPARIFMGDSGSMFLGFLLASLAIVRSQQASNVFAVVAVPVMVFLAPILDTSLVTLTRLLRGQSPAQGGTDHTTHRLIAFGLTPAQVALVLYGVAFVGGISSVAIEMMDYELSLILVPVILISLSLLTAYLGDIKIVRGKPAESTRVAQLAVDLVFKRNLIEILLDVALVSMSYYLGYWTRFGMDMTSESVSMFLRSWPAAIGVGLLSFKIFGIYQNIWGHLNVYYLLRIVGAAFSAVLVTGLAVSLIDTSINYPSGVWVMYFIYLLTSMGAARASFYILDRLVRRRSIQIQATLPERVLIYGAGPSGELAVKWMEYARKYTIVGFIDDDSRLWGRTFYEYPILGGSDQIGSLIELHKIEGVIASGREYIGTAGWEKVTNVCSGSRLWTRVVQISLELVQDR